MSERVSDVLDRLGDLADELAAVSRNVGTRYAHANDRGGAAECDGAAELATFLLRVRRAREAINDKAAQSDSAWTMLLDLASAELDSIMVTVSSLCAATTRPQTSAMRRLQGLVGAGLVYRRLDDQDQRRIVVGLTDKARAAMAELLPPHRRAKKVPEGTGRNAAADSQRTLMRAR
jgi:DNA-binding MarR family transcriptional regulator